MKRTVQMPFTGNPYLLTLWVRLYLERWKDEVDEVIILINGDNMDTDVELYCRSLLDFAEIPYIYTSTRIDHGPAIDLMLSLAKSRGCTHIGLIEEDAFVFKEGAIRDSFQLISDDAVIPPSFKIVAGRRGSCSQWLIELGKQLWDTEDHGPNFWPNFFFSPIEVLLETDRHFGARTWMPGDVVFRAENDFEYWTKGFETEIKWQESWGIECQETPLYVDCICKNQTVGDTFVNTSLQLRSRISPKEIVLLPQYHCVPEDLDNYANPPPYPQPFDGKCSWIHVGSLSSWYSLLMEKELAAYVVGSAPAEWERRVAFFILFEETLVDNCRAIGFAYWETHLEDFLRAYIYGIERIEHDYNLISEAIRKRVEIYRELMHV